MLKYIVSLNLMLKILHQLKKTFRLEGKCGKSITLFEQNDKNELRMHMKVDSYLTYK